MVVAVDLADLPAEVAQFRGERFEVEDLADAAEALDAVGVDDRHEVVQLVLGREEQRLPVGTLVHLAVAQQNERAPRLALALGGQRAAAAERQTVAERAGGKINAGDLVADVGHQARAVPAVGKQLLFREEAAQRERRVQGAAAVALAQDEAVAFRPLRTRGIDLEDAAVEHGQKVRHRKRAADVGRLCGGDHFHGLAADGGGVLCGIVHLGKGGANLVADVLHLVLAQADARRQVHAVVADVF